MQKIRIGHGFDIHQFQVGKPLILGGVIIPGNKGMLAHSDGDVVIHAICDALLGAAALGDIGQHFPDSDPRLHNASSRLFLRHIANLLSEKDYAIGNLDVTIIAQAPKLSPYLANMCNNLAEDLNIELSQVNIKATTMEKLDAIGREEGIAVQAVVLISAN